MGDHFPVTMCALGMVSAMHTLQTPQSGPCAPRVTKATSAPTALCGAQISIRRAGHVEATENAWRLVAEPHVSAKKAFWAMDVNMTVHEIELADLALHQVIIDNTEWFINLFLAACLLQLLVW